MRGEAISIRTRSFVREFTPLLRRCGESRDAPKSGSTVGEEGPLPHVRMHPVPSDPFPSRLRVLAPLRLHGKAPRHLFLPHPFDPPVWETCPVRYP
ncbi:MAG: hypothetical protein D6812_10955 [Deltaproteobacteria bacterium]|nr:MAG: hypothetical protein D6812_10955 [Deltaproteobacteria bacterium]